MLRVKNLKDDEGVMSYRKIIYSLLNVFGILGGNLKANLGVRCYLHLFPSFLKVLDIIKK